MLKLCVFGAGEHSRSFHLPALARYRSVHPGEIELAALCESDPGRAADAAARFGFARTYGDLDAMLQGERPDACLAFTPVELNVPVAIRLMRAGIPVLMEKPPGASLAEAREVVDVAAETGRRVMVSVNRRFDPSRRAALEWIGGRPIRYLRATVTRHERREAIFLRATGIHAIDAVVSLGGQVQSWTAEHQMVDGAAWWHIGLEFDGARGQVELLTTASCQAERYELFGAGFKVEIRNAERDDGSWRAWENGRLAKEVLASAEVPDFVANGTYAETEAFIAAVRGDTPYYPTPADVLPGVEICEAAARHLGIAS